MNYKNIFVETNLPYPLSDQQTIEYFTKYKNGDLDAKNIIIEHNIKIVLSIVLNQFVNSIYDKDDLLSVGLIGLNKSVETYNISKDTKFYTYATKCIINEILMYIRKNNRHVKVESLDREIYPSKTNNSDV